MFESLHSKFEKKDTDLYELEQEEGFPKYILIRSLDKATLKDVIKNKTGNTTSNSKEKALYQELFQTDITENELINIIKNTYPVVRTKRKKEEASLNKILKSLDIVKSGIHNDNLNDAAKRIVRDKTISSIKDFKAKSKQFSNSVIQYLTWQYYNQITNDLIEHIVNDNKNVIPTIRKIKYIDFFMIIDEKLIPFDLKITHISREFFTMHHNGISKDQIESFKSIEGDYDEFKEIKNLYDKLKEEHDLPAAKNSSILELLDKIKSKIEDETIIQKAESIEKKKELQTYYQELKKEYSLKSKTNMKVEEIIRILNQHNNDSMEELIKNRQSCLDELKLDRKELEWWNYKNQELTLFKNNNRFFIFLAYYNSLEDARKLKGDIENLKENINNSLNELKTLNKIRYVYEKDERNKEYNIFSASTIYIDWFINIK